MDAMLIIDMQEGLLSGPPKLALAAVVERINRVATAVRRRGGIVVFVQHHGPAGDEFAPGAPGWPLLGSLVREPADRIVAKTLNDAFFGTTLSAELLTRGVRRVIVTGWATDLCVDASVRSAAALGFAVVVGADCHTVSDRPHLDASEVIAHHHWVWTNLIAPHPVALASADALAADRD